jgi:hypothetical protein
MPASSIFAWDESSFLSGSFTPPNPRLTLTTGSHLNPFGCRRIVAHLKD